MESQNGSSLHPAHAHDHGHESHDGPAVHPVHAHAHSHEHRHEYKPIDRNYRLVVRTILWVIAGLVLLGLLIWWSVT